MSTDVSGRRRPRRRVRWVLLVVVVLAGAAVVVDRTHPYGVDFAHPLGRRDQAHPAGTDNVAATSTAAVKRATLAARTSVDGTLGYAGDYTGADVAQLNRDLVALGYGVDVGLDPSSDEFGWATKAAIKELQDALGVKQTGKLDLGQIVFLPTAVRVTSLTAILGGPAGGAALKGTSTTRQVTVELDAAQQSQLKVGDKVTITLPNGRTTPGTVTSVGKVASTPAKDSDTGPTVEVDITPTDAAATGTLDQAPVRVAITTDTVRNVLVVPVTSLLALAGGGYAVEVVAADGVHRLVPVTLGLFDDAAGRVQVTGSALAAGQHVVVPSS